MSNSLTRPPVITICGSTKHWDDHITAQAILGAKGLIGIPCAFTMKRPEIFPGLIDYLDRHEDTKRNLDVLHFHKIEISDAIWVVATEGYIGDSTKREIELAHRLGKLIMTTEVSDAFSFLSPGSVKLVPLSYDSVFPDALTGQPVTVETVRPSESLWLRHQVQRQQHVENFTLFVKEVKGQLGD